MSLLIVERGVNSTVIRFGIPTKLLNLVFQEFVIVVPYVLNNSFYLLVTTTGVVSDKTNFMNFKPGVAGVLTIITKVYSNPAVILSTFINVSVVVSPVPLI